jgi:hypothetical protein
MATVTASYNWVSGETVTPAKLNTAAAPTVVVADNEVTTAKILDANVTNAKLANDIDASKLTTGTLPIARIADDAVTNAKLSLAANAGEIKKALNADNDPPIFACRAWVNFDGTRNESDTGASANGANVKIRDSGNVSSVLKNNTADYTINFSTALPDENYACNISCNGASDSVGVGRQFVMVRTRSASQVRVQALFDDANTGATADPQYFAATIFR